MPFAGLLTLLTSLLPVLPVQVPLAPNQRWKDENDAIFSAEDPTEWNLHKLPNSNDTDHLVFETVHSLLQHWPNTRMRNGHNIVPGIIPEGTLLYHGSNVTELPPGPEWVATDPEHSQIFCQPNFEMHLSDELEGCWHLTLVATRPIKVVYFDGSSAAKMVYGTMDAQDLLVWGEALPENIWDEYRLIQDLCKWGKEFGVDGFVRMEMDFEVILCDFTSGVNVVSWANVACFNATLPIWPPFTVFEVMNAGSWHNHFPGETRIQLDLSGLVSFYDTQFAPSLVPTRVGQERWDHRVRDISSEDLSVLKSRLEEALVRPSGRSSGIDWKTLIQVIVDRFAQRFELARHLANSPATRPDEDLDLAKKFQMQLRIMLNPYLVLSATPSDPSDPTALDWTAPIYKRCATTHTDFMRTESSFMTDSEKLLLRAVRGTSREVCRVVTKMWAAGVYAGIDLSLNTQESPKVFEVAQVRSNWAEDLNRLMGWLDWSVWVKCDPECGPEEMCYLPTWPHRFLAPESGIGSPSSESSGEHPKRPSNFDLRDTVRETLAKKMSKAMEIEIDDWVRPQPRCVGRVAPWDNF